MPNLQESHRTKKKKKEYLLFMLNYKFLNTHSHI
jgi:hypothetical protein